MYTQNSFLKANTADSTRRLDILVDVVRISGFRGIENLEIFFDPVTVLIGANNTGKSTVLKALSLALGDYGNAIYEEDFHLEVDKDGKVKVAKEIVVDVRIIPLGSDGKRAATFNQKWQMEFGNKIKVEADTNQFVAIRTKVSANLVKCGFKIEHYSMDKWLEFSSWLSGVGELTKMPLKLESLALFSVDAKRDIHAELKDKSSFVGRFLSSVKYEEKIIADIEKAIERINEETIDNCAELQQLKEQLSQLKQTFQGTGSAEITPFPKKIRDLSKNFSIYLGETEQSTFAVEYYGYGTRSWASLLAVKAFIDRMRMQYEREEESFFPILAAEEPEAHLHPSAQKTLYQQLAVTHAQVIVTTHSPYVLPLVDIYHVRSLTKKRQKVVSRRLQYQVSSNEKKKLEREVIKQRGEILFSRALILCEGITEEQIIPAMFEVFGNMHSTFSLGVSCVQVGGVANYSGFIKLACSFGIPIFIVSDNDQNSKEIVERQIAELKEKGLPLTQQTFEVAYLEDGNDIEAELVNELKLQDEIKEALFHYEAAKLPLNEHWANAKKTEIEKLNDKELLQTMRQHKARYASFLAEVIRENPNNKKPENLIIKAAKSAFNTIEDWLKL